MMSFRLILFVALLPNVAACVKEAERPWGPPDEKGPFDVGRTTLYFDDVRGKSLVADVWYPANVDEEDVLSNYEPTNITGMSYRDPELDLSHGPHPVVAFSHGYISVRYQSFYLMEHLASHGFVVISPDHQFNTLFDLDQRNDAQMMLERPDDVRYSVDHLFSLSNESGRFKDGLETDGYAAMGHSFGAVTVMRLGGGVVDWQALDAHCTSGQGNGRVCEVLAEIDGSIGEHGETDPRIRTTVPMSPGIWYAFGEDGKGLESLQEPFVLAGEADDILHWETEAKPSWLAMTGPKRLALFADVGHYGFSFLCEVLPNFRPECDGPAGGWAELSWVHDRSQTLVMAHLGVSMLKDERYLPWLAAVDEEKLHLELEL